MIRTINGCEKNVRAIPAALSGAIAAGADGISRLVGNEIFSPLTIAAATSSDVIPDQTKSSEEVVSRFIQNVGANDCFYAIGQDCTPNGYHGLLKAGLQLSVSENCERVSVYSTAGTTIAVTVFLRKDLYQRPNTVPAILP